MSDNSKPQTSGDDSTGWKRRTREELLAVGLSGLKESVSQCQANARGWSLLGHALEFLVEEVEKKGVTGADGMAVIGQTLNTLNMACTAAFGSTSHILGGLAVLFRSGR